MTSGRFFSLACISGMIEHMPPIKSMETTLKRFWTVIILLALFLTLAILALIYQSSQTINWRSSPLFGGDEAVTMGSAVGAPGVSEMMLEKSDITSAPSIAPAPDFAPVPPFNPNGATPEDRERVGTKIIQNGSLSLRVDNAEQRLKELREIADQTNGFIASAHIVDNAGIKTAYATIRVPVEQFDATMEKIKLLASTVFSESTNAEDVTAQYVDLDARLRAAEAEETQYLNILQQAKTVEDTLNVTARLAEVRTRIEQLQGQMRYLTDRTDYATIQVTMTEEARVEVPTRVWKPGETFRTALRELVIALQATVDALIAASVFFIGLLLPILIVLGLIAWLIFALWKKLFSRKRKS